MREGRGRNERGERKERGRREMEWGREDMMECLTNNKLILVYTPTGLL